MLIAEAMTNNAVCLPATATVKQAAVAMLENDIGDVLVVDRKGGLQGIVTDRDLTVRALAGGKAASTKLKEIMSDEPVVITSMEGVERAAQVMSEQALRRLPVVDDGKIMGVITLGDVARKTKTDTDPTLADISKAPANH